MLLKRPPADAFQTLTIFSAEHGALFVLQRVPKPAGHSTTKAKPASAASPPLDLFDEVALALESSNQGRTWFVKEARVLARAEGIGRSYDALRLASALTALIARNPVHDDSRAAVSELLRGALAAFASAVRPDIVYFKSVYRFARDEGYPLKEQWFPTLPAADRTEVVTLLNRPLAEQSAAPELVARFQRRLEEYLRGHTEILME